MPEYKAPLRDMRFVFHELLDVDSHYRSLPGCEELTGDVFDAMLAELGRFIETVIAPTNLACDQEGCTWSPEGVTTPKAFKDIYRQYREQGIGGLPHDPKYEGQGLPRSLNLAVGEMVCAANSSFSMYPGLTSGAIDAIEAHGSEEQKQKFLPKMTTGEWSGTMCLTEAHAGSDLGILRSKAEPKGDGSYRITGEKVFISAGEHDLTENIIHLVLARLPDAPPGTKGISLFIVPKFLVRADGSVGERNGVTCTSIEHKMGIKASATCVLHFEEAEGYLIGAPHRGLACMFTMMNVARLGTAVQGMALGERSFQGALAYAKERLQMRSLSGPKAPDKAADPIIVHPDVRRMLLTQKAFAEGSRALIAYCGLLADIVHAKPGSEEAKDANAQLELLTPIAKAFLTDLAFESTNLGVQVLGGHGYISEHGMEQLVRDARIQQIYEGANGIQALDLLGRKVLANEGVRLRRFLEQAAAFCAEQAQNQAMGELIAPLSRHLKEWGELSAKIGKAANKNPEEVGAASYDFLSYSGYVTFAYFFARSAAVAHKALAAGSDEAAFYQAKLFTARFYFRRILPRTRGLVETMLSGAEDVMGIDAEHMVF